jgi:putative oxidoreductase
MSSVAPTATGVVVTPTYHPAVTLIARLLMAALFIIFGIRKVLAFTFYAGYFAKLGFPAPEVMVVLAIIIEVGVGLLFAIGWRTRQLAWLLVLYTVIATFMAHRYWGISDAGQYANQMSHFWKNITIIGGLMMVGVFGPGPISVDKR